MLYLRTMCSNLLPDIGAITPKDESGNDRFTRMLERKEIDFPTYMALGRAAILGFEVEVEFDATTGPRRKLVIHEMPPPLSR